MGWMHPADADSMTNPLELPFEGIAPAWLAGAEVSFRLGHPRANAISFFFDNDAEFRDFLSVTNLPAVVWERETAMRSRFTVLERYWIKLEVRDDGIGGYSQYFQLDPRSRYPISSLRVFLRSHGVGDVSRLEETLRGPLQREDTVWGLVLKPTRDGGAQPRLSCTVPRDELAELLEALHGVEQLEAGQRVGYLQWNASLPGSARVFVSFDPRASGAVALDFENVPGASLGDDWDGLGVGWSATRPLPYLKCRLAPGSSRPEWTAYLRRSSLQTHLERRARTHDDALEAARWYYDDNAGALVASLGTTYQAGLLKTPKPSLDELARATNRWIAERAGLQPNMRVLDARAVVRSDRRWT
jgi:hypothetical protein